MADVIEHLPQRRIEAGRQAGRQAGRRVRGGSAVPAPAPAQQVETLTALAREELREIVRRLALGDQPGIEIEPVHAN